jgi:ABC-2 type transport system permease protein
VFVFILFTSSYAPLHLLAGWLRAIATVNPINQVVDALRAGFVGGVTWHETWPGLLALLGLGVLFGALALRGLRRTGA